SQEAIADTAESQTPKLRVGKADAAAGIEATAPAAPPSVRARGSEPVPAAAPPPPQPAPLPPAEATGDVPTAPRKDDTASKLQRWHAGDEANASGPGHHTVIEGGAGRATPPPA